MSTLPICTTCGLQILDIQDIEYTLDAQGNVTATFHTDAFHRELDDDDPATGCVDPDHGIGDHPCDEVLGPERAAALRDTGYEERISK